MAKQPPAPAVPPVPDEDEEVFSAFGITEDEDKERVRGLAAARVLAHRRIKKLDEQNPPLKKKRGWGEE